MTETPEDIAFVAQALAAGQTAAVHNVVAPQAPIAPDEQSVGAAPDSVPESAEPDATMGVSPQPDRVPLEPMPHGTDLVTEPGGQGPHAGYPGGGMSNG